jgi:hypothetical protein
LELKIEMEEEKGTTEREVRATTWETTLEKLPLATRTLSFFPILFLDIIVCSFLLEEWKDCQVNRDTCQKSIAPKPRTLTQLLIDRLRLWLAKGSKQFNSSARGVNITVTNLRDATYYYQGNEIKEARYSAK